MRRNLVLLPALLLCGLSTSATAAPPVKLQPKTTAVRPKPTVSKIGGAGVKPLPSPSRAVMGTKSGRASFDITKLPLNEQQRLVQGGLEPDVSAAALDVLRQFAETGGGALAKIEGSNRAAAKTIVARIDALSSNVRTQALGSSGGKGKVSSSMASAAYTAGPALVGVGTATDTLPAQGVPAPQAYALEIAGVRSLTAQESDGDELIAVASFIAVGAGGTTTRHDASVPASGVLSLAGGAASSKSSAIFSGKGYGVLVSGLFEVETTDDPARDEFETMLGLAQALAQQIGKDPVADLAFAVDYSAGLLSLSDPARWPAGSVVKTIIASGTDDPTSLHGLYATPPESTQGIAHKLVHEHAAGAGHYEVLFDVPAPDIAHPNVVVKLTRIQSIDGVDAGSDQDDLEASVQIRSTDSANDQEYTSKELPTNHDVYTTPWIVQRKMVDDHVRVSLWLSDFTAGPASGYVSGTFGGGSYCGKVNGHTYPPCPDVTTPIDLDPQTGGEWGGQLSHPGAELDIDLKTGKITGDATGQVGSKLVVQGDESPRGKIELVITVQP